MSPSLTSRPSVRVAALTVAAALSLAGCSSSSSGGSGGAPAGGGSSSTGGSQSTGTPATSNGIAALVPKSIASKGTLTFAMDPTYPPDESKDGSTIVGFDADLANALAPVMGLKAQLQSATFDDIIPGLQSGKYDVGLSSFTDTSAREKVVDFVTYFKAGEAFYVKAGSSDKFNGLKSLCGHTVAVETGTVEQDDAKAQAKKCSVKVLTFSDQNQANLAVSGGRADVGFADSQVAGYIVKQSNGQFESSGQPFGVAPYGIALPKGNGMAKAVLAAMKQLISDGTYKKLLAKWGVQSGGITTPVIDGATS